MRIGIDATNIKRGGGLNHLKEVISNLNRKSLDIEKVIIWTNDSIIEKIPKFDWIKSIDTSKRIKSWVGLFKWQSKTFTEELLTEGCDVLFVPGGTYIGDFRPFVTMAQNLLPFDKAERKKYRYSKEYFRYIMLEHLQSYTFKRADGVIFLSDYSANKINVEKTTAEIKTIYHGVDKSFFNINRKSSDFNNNENSPIKLLYVSIINYYKNQINVVKAFEDLIIKGYNVELDLVGPAYYPALMELKKYISGLDKIKNKLRYMGNVEHNILIDYYNNSDIFIFASSCETFGMILLEAMASGLPIACSNISSMPEILEGNGEYFNPNDPNSISVAIEKIISLNNNKINYSKMALKRAKKFTWEKCSNETFKFISSKVQKRLDIK